jgi:hypothetical protein
MSRKRTVKAAFLIKAGGVLEPIHPFEVPHPGEFGELTLNETVKVKHVSLTVDKKGKTILSLED